MDRAATGVPTEGQAEKVIAQLREALGTRELIGQAKGILMATRGVNSEAAWAVLSQASQDSNVKVARLSRAICSLVAGESPDSDDPALRAAHQLLRGTPAGVTRDELAKKRDERAEARDHAAEFVAGEGSESVAEDTASD
ncbi:MAG: hypothetical protein QOH80_41 [Actinomycetota bacterium]|jgi:hypothetical protein|nr:hypothetical protein [Actinomycetota bacterium]